MLHIYTEYVCIWILELRQDACHYPEGRGEQEPRQHLQRKKLHVIYILYMDSQTAT